MSFCSDPLHSLCHQERIKYLNKNDKQHVLRGCCVPDTWCKSWVLWNRLHHYCHFSDEETETFKLLSKLAQDTPAGNGELGQVDFEVYTSNHIYHFFAKLMWNFAFSETVQESVSFKHDHSKHPCFWVSWQKKKTYVFLWAGVSTS